MKKLFKSIKENGSEDKILISFEDIYNYTVLILRLSALFLGKLFSSIFITLKNTVIAKI